MSDASNKEFFDLLSSVTSSETFGLTLTDGKEYQFRQLSTSQLRDLVKTVVDSPITQIAFNEALTKVMKESLIEESSFESFNVIDRLLFCLETRIQSISPSVKVLNDDETIVVDLQHVKKKILESISSTSIKASVQEASLDNSPIKIAYALPLLSTEQQLDSEIYKNIDFEIENEEQLRKILGQTFINEIAKTVRTIEINDKQLDLSTVSFESRIKAIESLPALLVNQVIEFVETYKKSLDSALTTEQNVSLTIDGSLFSLR